MQISSQSIGSKSGSFVLVLDSGDRLSMFGQGHSHLIRLYADRLVSDTGYETAFVTLNVGEARKLYDLLGEGLGVTPAQAAVDDQVG